MRMHRLALIGIALILLLSVPIRAAQAEHDLATVHLVFVDTYSGEDVVGTGTVKSFTREVDNSSVDLANKFNQNKASDIPFGVYHLRAHLTGFFTIEKDVYVFQPQTWAVLGLKYGTIDVPPPAFSLSGKVRNAQSSKSQIRLRLLGVYSDVSLDTKLDDSGAFEFAGVPQATYILVTIRGNRMLDARRVQSPQTEAVDIDLGEKPASR